MKLKFLTIKKHTLCVILVSVILICSVVGVCYAVRVVSSPKPEYSIVIDAGHGGEDPGTIANGITEKDYTLKISEYIHNRLDEMGIPNELTRETDVTLDSNSRPKKVQSFYGNGDDVIVVSNHINAGGGKQPLSEVGLQSDLRHI